MSLFTELLAGALGEDLHKYFDPFLFYDDEECSDACQSHYIAQCPSMARYFDS